jgi:hypothetical protein
MDLLNSSVTYLFLWSIYITFFQNIFMLDNTAPFGLLNLLQFHDHLIIVPLLTSSMKLLFTHLKDTSIFHLVLFTLRLRIHSCVQVPVFSNLEPNLVIIEFVSFLCVQVPVIWNLIFYINQLYCKCVGLSDLASIFWSENKL